MDDRPPIRTRRTRQHAGYAAEVLRSPTLLAALCLACASAPEDAAVNPPAPLVVTSTAFADGGPIPAEFTCDGEDVSPPLAWSGAPAGTRSFAIIVDDPDAPKGTWVHWVVYDLPPTTTSLPRDASSALPEPARHGKNGWGDATWGGACPPSGRHRYVHRVYALDTTTSLVGTPTRAQLDEAMDGHILAAGELVGTYQKR